jgi:hypothetical protein
MYAQSPPEQQAESDALRAKCLELARQAAQAAGMGTGLGAVAQFLLLAGRGMMKPTAEEAGGNPPDR